MVQQMHVGGVGVDRVGVYVKRLGGGCYSCSVNPETRFKKTYFLLIFPLMWHDVGWGWLGEGGTLTK